MGAFGEVGEMVTNQFEQFNDALNQCQWFLFPKKVQQMLVIFIANTQQPPIIQGYANRLCARDTFKRVNFKSNYVFKFSGKWPFEISAFISLPFSILDHSNDVLLLRSYASSWLKSFVKKWENFQVKSTFRSVLLLTRGNCDNPSMIDTWYDRKL